MAKRKRYEDVMLLAAGEAVAGQHTRYVVERMVGLGAYGAVYAAQDPETPGRQIALKEFFPARSPREQAPLQALFDRERTVGMQASPHPLMPTFYEAFQADGHFYIAQEFIAGSALDEIITRRHPITREWVLKWSVSLCDALAFLHAHQIVHHDLKPANIRITPQGHLVLLDFGAAQYFGAGHENDTPAELYGTEGYLPPELEADGRWIADIRTDIFALGCILYEMIAGVAPDQSQINERAMSVTNALIQRPNADLGLVKLINKAVSYNTEYRYATAGAFLQEMRLIAPPVLLVTKKHLRFGEVVGGRLAPALTVSLYNAGGGEITGAILPRSPWIVASQTRFTGNFHEVSVRPDLAKIAERGQLVSGRLDIISDDQTGPDGGLIAGDRWMVECSAFVSPTPGTVVVSGGDGAAGSPVLLAGRRGQDAAGQAVLTNPGELPVEFRITTVPSEEGPALNIVAVPPDGVLGPQQSVTVALSARTESLAAGSYPATLTVQSPDEPGQAVPATVRVLSPLDYLKARLGGR